MLCCTACSHLRLCVWEASLGVLMVGMPRGKAGAGAKGA